ncbi:Glycoside hydrolase [Mycobacterium sp. smrl_JER01]
MVCGSVAAVLVAALSMGGVLADPAADALAKLDELSRTALQTRTEVTAAQRDAEDKQAAQEVAEDRHRADLTELEGANARLQPLQDAVDRVAAMTYVGGGAGQWSAVLNASSPQQLIDELTLQRALAGALADQMEDFRAARERAAAAARASERSAVEARTAAEQSAAVRTELQARWSDLQRQILAAEAQYAVLTPHQQAVIDNAAAVLPPVPGGPPEAAMPGLPPGDVLPPVAVPPPPAGLVDIPESLPVGVASEVGLQPNTIMAARAISARFPQIATIDGVRPDSKPWHPAGLAIDVMIPNPDSAEGIALGDEILAFMMANAARFGLQDVIWRGTYHTPAGPQGSGYGHYDHVHITTTPRR